MLYRVLLLSSLFISSAMGAAKTEYDNKCIECIIHNNYYCNSENTCWTSGSDKTLADCGGGTKSFVMDLQACYQTSVDKSADASCSQFKESEFTSTPTQITIQVPANTVCFFTVEDDFATVKLVSNTNTEVSRANEFNDLAQSSITNTGATMSILT